MIQFTLDLLEIKQKSVNGHINGVTGQDWIRINYVIDDHPMTYKRVEFKMLPEHISTFTEFTSNQNTSRYRNSLDSSSTSSEPESPAADPLIPDDQIALHQISADNPRTKRKNTTIKTPTSISANLPAPNDGDVDWDGPEEVILISALIKDAWAQPPGAPPPKGSWIPISKSFNVPGGIHPTPYQCERYHGRMRTSFKETGYLMIHHNGQWNNSINQVILQPRQWSLVMCQPEPHNNNLEKWKTKSIAAFLLMLLLNPIINVSHTNSENRFEEIQLLEPMSKTEQLAKIKMEAVRQFDLDGGVPEVQRVEALGLLLANVSLT
ncbi:hypothetical protein Pst134EB_016145 [Puccinia striiformis f. sp. tritici]|nr:hypothetical protein Pst134EB_016145 [Puccinia striiformis f. sp. tritici]